MIHKLTCRYALRRGCKSVPWLWAESKTKEQLQDAAATHNLIPCRVCQPLT